MLYRCLLSGLTRKCLAKWPPRCILSALGYRCPSLVPVDPSSLWKNCQSESRRGLADVLLAAAAAAAVGLPEENCSAHITPHPCGRFSLSTKVTTVAVLGYPGVDQPMNTRNNVYVCCFHGVVRNSWTPDTGGSSRQACPWERPCLACWRPLAG